MPRSSQVSSGPPPAMTWSGAAPVLILAVIFDILRFLFEWFVFFGPALAAGLCTAATGGTLSLGVICGVAAAGGGIAAAPALETFGIVMAMAVGLIGWLVIGIILLKANARIFRENAVWFVASLLGSELPFLGSIPFMTAILWRMYAVQIRKEKDGLRRYQDAQTAEQLRQRQQLAAQIASQEAAAANDSATGEEIPEDEQQTA